MMHPEYEILSSDDDGDSSLHTGRVVPVYEAAGKVNTRVFRTLIHRVLESLPLADRSLAAAHSATDEAAGPLERHPRAAFSAAGFGPAAAEFVPVAGAVPADLRGILLARMRPGAEARQGPPGSRDRLSIERARPRAHQANAAVPPDRRAEARAGGDRARYGGSASHVPAAARRRRQREDAGGGRGRDYRHRKRLPGGGAGAHGNPGGAALLLFQETVSEARLHDDSADGFEHRARERCSSRSWRRRAWRRW